MKETVRSGRRANFYITENSFIDDYAREVGLGGIAVYHVLERYTNCETRSTWIGTAKMARLLDLSQRSVQRHLKTLEDLGLIRIVRTETLTTYFVVPVPQRQKSTSTPLFDQVSEQVFQNGDTHVAEATAVSQMATPVSRSGDTRVALYKEEQNLFNKTSEQDENNPNSARRSAERVIAVLGLPATSSNFRMVEAAVAAEATYSGLTPEESAELITKAAMEDNRNGIAINKFYFEDAKWRGNRRGHARISKAEQRKLDNLEINARVKQRFRERFGDS